MPELDVIIHQPVRLRIMAALTSLGPREQVDFGYLREKLGLTDGNLGSHLRALEDAGYVVVEKTFVERRPKTFLTVSPAGRKAFGTHVAALQAIIKPG
ncbi:MAG TPA: transcriptional regulator [Opitutaceae bacterium]|nr:transcriptional regulator [Opitutaceae bacterium]